MEIKSGNIESSILVMHEVAKWLIDKNESLWKINDLTKEVLLCNNLTEDNFYTGWECEKPIASMILQWHDPELWPNIKPFESGFIHKLCVSREYAGKEISREMILFAELECKNRGIKILRLDCAGDRQKLCNFYESYGFIKVDRKNIGIYDIAFYEKNIV
jgi:ribosomal protein S18 acetylase RimI-like enzyme